MNIVEDKVFKEWLDFNFSESCSCVGSQKEIISFFIFVSNLQAWIVPDFLGEIDSIDGAKSPGASCIASLFV